MRLLFRRTYYDYQNPSRRLLLADYGSRLPRLRQKMQTMQKTWQPYSLETRKTPFYTIPVALRKMGNGRKMGKGQVKFLIVSVHYFTKWIEAKPLATITIQQVQQFVWKEIICRYGVPHTIITGNGRQFIDKELAKFYISLGIKHVTSSVEHPQTNG